MKGLFILPVGTDVRYDKRLLGVTRAGVQTQVMHFERDYYEGGPLPSDEAIPLGTVRHGRYLERVPTLLKASPKVERMIGDFDFVYAFGLDMLSLALWSMRGLRRRPVVVYEVGDVGNLTSEGLAPRIMRRIERRTLASTDLLVVTAPLFAEDYYVPVQGIAPEKIRVLENKLDPTWTRHGRPVNGHAAAPRMRIGYFGLIRCAGSWETLKAISELGGDDVSIYLRGLLQVDGIEKDLERLPNVRYGGTFVEPDDLAAMYDAINISWTAQSGPSFRWARTTRFYKACAYGKPQLVNAGTADARAVAELGTGLAIDVSKPDEAARQVLAISPGQMAEWTQRSARIPTAVYAYVDDHEKLVADIAAIVRRNSADQAPA